MEHAGSDPRESPLAPFDGFFAGAFGRRRGTFAQEDVLDTRTDIEQPMGPTNHRCLIFDSDVDQLAVVVPFVRASLERGARCLYVTDEHDTKGVASALQSGGIAVAGAVGGHALRIMTKGETYHRWGAFDPGAMVTFLSNAQSEAISDGFTGLDVTTEMTWSLGSEPGNERVIEYEAKLNSFLTAHRDLVVLDQYNRRRFDSKLIGDVIRTHPIVGFGGEMAHNVYYIPPEEFLNEPQALRSVDRMLANITTRHRIAKELRAASYYTRSLYDLNLDALATTTPTGAIRDVNKKMESLLGMPREAILNTDLTTHFVEQTRAREFLAQVRDEGAVANFTLTALAKTGETTPVSLNAFVLRDDAGRIGAIISSSRDLSEERRVEELRERALESSREFDRVRTDFVSRVSHELRSPLTSVLGYVELLTDDDASPLDDEQRSMLGVIERNGLRLLKLVEDLLTMSRGSAGTTELHRARITLSPIVGAALEGFRPEMAKRQLTCETTVEDGLQLNADAEEIERMIVNLLSNAVKFSDPGGTISVVGRRDGDDAQLSVRDTGIGIPIDEQPQLFTRFFRSSLSQELETQGTGIGLFLVKQIVEAHDGTVAGTTVVVRLPQADGVVAATPAT